MLFFFNDPVKRHCFTIFFCFLTTQWNQEVQHQVLICIYKNRSVSVYGSVLKIISNYVTTSMSEGSLGSACRHLLLQLVQILVQLNRWGSVLSVRFGHYSPLVCIATFFQKRVSMVLCHTNGSRALFTGPTNLFFSKNFIKNWSYGTIHTFKNYFATVFLIFSNKRHSNGQ